MKSLARLLMRFSRGSRCSLHKKMWTAVRENNCHSTVSLAERVKERELQEYRQFRGRVLFGLHIPDGFLRETRA